jgi:hypothetical protein
VAEDQNGEAKPPRSARGKKPTLVEVPCPDNCTNGEVLAFNYMNGTHYTEACRRCMGAGSVEVQR